MNLFGFNTFGLKFLFEYFEVIQIVADKIVSQNAHIVSTCFSCLALEEKVVIERICRIADRQARRIETRVRTG